MAEDMAEKKLRGSGGYAIAKITDDEQKRGNLGGPELFLAGIGRLDEDRFQKYYCNKCEKEYEGAPSLSYENPNEELGEGVTLAEKGEYKCPACSSTIAQYRKFETSAVQEVKPQPAPRAAEQVQAAPATMQARPKQDEWVPMSVESTPASPSAGFISLQSLVGMTAYDSEAMHIGKIEDAGIRKTADGMQVTFKVGGKEVGWDKVSKIGDIILLRSASFSEVPASPAAAAKCPSCGFQNDAGAVFCADCGSKL
jgi:sporulation protein YlmC with PRC-barrel domain